MERMVIFLGLTLCHASGQLLENDSFVRNGTDPNKDMYVIRAMVYQVGILTNMTNNTDLENKTHSGNQESLTFYHTNGSNIDLSKIPEPLLTNVTGESFVGLAPALAKYPGDLSPAGWVTGAESASTNEKKDMRKMRISRRASAFQDYEEPREQDDSDFDDIARGYRSYPRTLRSLLGRTMDVHRVWKRDAEKERLVKVEEGNSFIPDEASIQSLSIPPLLSLNGNLSEIPVPIPNTSVVHYAKINTLVKSSDSQ